MENKNLLDEIRDSARDVEVPDRLKPEEIQKRLKASKNAEQEAARDVVPKKKMPFWRYGTCAAAVVLFVTAGSIMAPILKGNEEAAQKQKAREVSAAGSVERENTEETTAEQTEETTAVTTEVTTAEATTEITNEASAEITNASSAIPHLENYEELYAMLQAYENSQLEAAVYTTTDRGTVVESEVAEVLGTAPEEEFVVTEEAVESFESGTSSVQSETETAAEASMDTAVSGTGATAEMETSDSASTENDYSSTNTQEIAVDEADVVKTDGTYIYALDNNGVLRIVNAKEMEVVSEISLDSGSSAVLEMYVDGNLLQVVKQEERYMTYEEELELPNTGSSETEQFNIGNSETEQFNTASSDTGQFNTSRSETEPFNTENEGTDFTTTDNTFTTRSYYSIPVTLTIVETYDISDRTQPKKAGSYAQDGSYLSSGKNGDVLYLFTSYCPQVGPDADAREYYVPKTGEEYLPYEDIYLPVQIRKDSTVYRGGEYLVASAVANDAPDRAKDCMAVVSGADTFYVSENNIYAATPVWENNGNSTELIRFGYQDGIFTPGSSGSVPGELNDNFSMDEQEGYLRIVTTVENTIEETDGMVTSVTFTKNNGLYILDQNLQIQGKIEGLAEGEDINSARFFGDTGYFVTYRNIDPLFSVDLSDPQNPQLLGELKITGFSEYLHFYGENRLLGMGWETDPETGAQQGLKCTMFDISNPRDVQVTSQLLIKDAVVCDALSNYKAILANADKNIFGFAYAVNRGQSYLEYNMEENFYYGVFSYTEEGIIPLNYFRLADGDIYEEGMDYEDYQSLRGIYIGDMFYLVSNRGIEAYDMASDFTFEEAVIW